jgi:hypothetical protein
MDITKINIYNEKNNAKNNVLNDFTYELCIDNIKTVNNNDKYIELGNYLENINNTVIIYSVDSYSINTSIKISKKKYNNIKIIYLTKNNIYDLEFIKNNGKDTIMIGLNDDDILCQNNSMLKFTYKNIRTKGLNVILNNIIKIIKNKDVHIVYDLSILDNVYAPLLNNKNNETKGFDIMEIKNIFQTFKNLNIKCIDVINYNLNENDVKFNFRLMCESLRVPLLDLFEFKEQSINIFNEYTKFIIWRPLEQIDDDDIGWYILRNIPTKDKEIMIKHIDDNKINILPLDDDIYMVATTTIDEQNKKFYYTANNIDDLTLFTYEKNSMIFELTNSYK